MEEPRIPLRELRPWLWLPVAALVFVGITRVLYADVRELEERGLIDGIALASSVITGLLTLPLRAKEVRRRGAVGLFLALTVSAYAVCAAAIIPVGVVTGGGDLSTLPDTASMGLLFMSVAFFVTFWVSLPLGAATGLIVWTYAHRLRTARARSTDG